MKISNRIYINQKDLERSKEIVKELSRLAGELPKVKAQENELKEKYYNEIYEPLRKARVLDILGSSRTDDVKRLEQAERLSIYEIGRPKEEFDIRCEMLEKELHTLTTPVCSEAIELLQRELKDVYAIERGRFLGVENRFVDKQESEAVEKVMKVETNFEAVAKARDSIMELIGHCRGGLLNEPLDNIIKEIEKFEDRFNKIDFAVNKPVEISPTIFKDLREAGKI